MHLGYLAFMALLIAALVLWGLAAYKADGGHFDDPPKGKREDSADKV